MFLLRNIAAPFSTFLTFSTFLLFLGLQDLLEHLRPLACLDARTICINCSIRMQNCPDITILNSILVFFVFLSFRRKKLKKVFGDFPIEIPIVKSVSLGDAFQMSKSNNKNCSELPLTNGMGLDRAPIRVGHADAGICGSCGLCAYARICGCG